MLTWFSTLTLWAQIAVGALAVIAGLVVLWMIFSLVLIPLLALIQRALDPAENTTSTSSAAFLVGTLTLKVDAAHTGEVMVTGGGGARQTYPAKLWHAEGERLPQGTQVVVVEMKAGVAYVTPYTGGLATRLA